MERLNDTLALEAVDYHRNEDCVDYEDCLDLASKSRWPSFSCLDCKAYKPDPEFAIAIKPRVERRMAPSCIGNAAGISKVKGKPMNQHITEVMRKNGYALVNSLGQLVKEVK